jgi:hypothetical protein
MRLTRRVIVLGIGVLVISPLLAAFVGSSVGNGILHPMRLNAMRLEDTQKMLERTGGTREDFSIKARIAGESCRDASFRRPSYLRNIGSPHSLPPFAANL